MKYPPAVVKYYLIGKGMNAADAELFSQQEWVQNYDKKTAPKGVELNEQTIAQWKANAKKAGTSFLDYAQQKLAPQTITAANPTPAMQRGVTAAAQAAANIPQPVAPTTQMAGNAPSPLPQDAAQLRSLASSVGANFTTPRPDIAEALTPQPPIGRELDRPTLTNDPGFQQAPQIGGQGMSFKPGGTVGAWWTPERVQQGYNTLRAGGVSDLGAQALMARFAGVEAPAGPTASNSMDGGHWGIAQWGLARGGRGLSTDYQTQLDKVVKELQGPESAALKRLNAATTPREAAIGAASFERAGGYPKLKPADAFVPKTLAAMDRIVPGGPDPFANVEQTNNGMTPIDWATANAAPTTLPGPTPDAAVPPTTYPMPPAAPPVSGPSMAQAPLEPPLSGGNLLGRPTNDDLVRTFSPDFQVGVKAYESVPGPSPESMSEGMKSYLSNAISPPPAPTLGAPSGPAGTVPIGANTYLPQSAQTMSAFPQPPMSMMPPPPIMNPMPPNLPPLGGPTPPPGFSIANGPSFGSGPNMPTADFGTNPIFGTGMPPTPGAPVVGGAPTSPFNLPGQFGFGVGSTTPQGFTPPGNPMFPMANAGLPEVGGAPVLPSRRPPLYGYGPKNPTGAGTYDTRGAGPVAPDPITHRGPGSSAIPGNMGIASGTPPSAIFGHGIAAPIVPSLFRGGGIMHGPGGIGLVEDRMRNLVGPGAYGMNVGFSGGGF